jgi:diguanylate cyclase (GGDEF)-like protein/PAS domain S-box-containing protein
VAIKTLFAQIGNKRGMGMQHVLIVDDRPTNQNIFAKLASSIADDIAVQTCGDPVEALGLLEICTPDLIIVDYSMPGMTGAEFTREVRRRPPTHEVPIIVITAYNDRDFRLTALEAGATDFLQSPVDRREFQSRARNLLAFRRQQLSVKSRAAELELDDDKTHQNIPILLGTEVDLLGQVLDTIPIMINTTDRAGRCVFVNSHQAAILGTTPSALVGSDISSLFGEARGKHDRQMNEMVVASGRAVPPYEDVIDHEGIRLVYLTSKAPLRDPSGEVVGVLTSAVDITGRKRAENHLNHMARHDVLTGLPNRILFRDRLQAEIETAQRTGQLVAVFLLDLDRFKLINDTRGHHVGDQLLEKVAARIGTTLSQGDCAARLGGDEFAIIQTGLQSEAEIGHRAERLLREVAHTYGLDHHDVMLTASLGISLSPADGTSPDELLRTADLAMYDAKGAGGNAYRFFHAEMNQQAQAAAALEADLHAAIEHQQFELHYQPQMSAKTGEIYSAEALIRWNHPQRGLLAPGAFLKLAEETGLIIPIGAWVLRQACRQLVAWRHDGLEMPHISVNLSALQFQRQDVFDLVRAALDETGLDPGSLELEIVESVLVQNRIEVAETLCRLRELGVRIAIDDFGTGYSSLQYLRDLPVDCLKIDRSFVTGLPFSSKDAAIVNAMTGLGHDLGMTITAEGVETEEQLLMLRTIGCDHLQGFYLGMPCAAGEFRQLARKAAALHAVPSDQRALGYRALRN